MIEGKPRGAIHVHRPVADRVGIFASVLCLIHCLLLPVLVPLLPLVAGVAGTESVHEGLLVLLTLCAILAFVPGVRAHRAYSIVAFGGLGVLLLAGGVLAHDWPALAGLDTPLTVVGGLMLVTTHFFNSRLCQACPVCRAEQEELES